MSDNIPFDIQMDIIKKVYDVKSLIQFRSVSKPWKSFIDSPKFINGYNARHTRAHSGILRSKLGSVDRFICLVEDDNNETFKVQQQDLAPFVVSPFLKRCLFSTFVGECYGLLCFYGYHNGYKERMVLIWNPSIGKSFGIAHPSLYSMAQADTRNQLAFGFGVCPVTRDPTVVKITYAVNVTWHVEVYTLSSGVWNVIPSGNLPRQSITLNDSTQVVIDRFIYWGAREQTFTDDGEAATNYMVVSFDLITKEFKVVDLPDILTNGLDGEHLSVSKLRESLVVYVSIYVDGAHCCGVWVMEHDSSFRKLFTIGTPVDYILGFRKSGEPIFETRLEDLRFTTLNVYDPCSQEVKNLGIFGEDTSFFMGSYKESLLLLDHSDSHIYSDDS